MERAWPVDTSTCDRTHLAVSQRQVSSAFSAATVNSSNDLASSSSSSRIRFKTVLLILYVEDKTAKLNALSPLHISFAGSASSVYDHG
jgi:hypothetical protein